MRTCLEVGHIRPVVAGSGVTLGVKLDLRHKRFSEDMTFGFDHFSVKRSTLIVKLDTVC